MLKLNKPMIDKKVLEYSETLKKLGIEHTIVEHPHLVAVEDVLKYCNLTFADGASTLVFKVDNGYIAVIRRDDCKIDLKRLQKLAGTKLLKMATNEEFSELTKLEPGAARIYIPEVQKTFIDDKVMERDFVQAGSGSFMCSIQYRVEDLVKLPKSAIVSLSELMIHDSKSGGSTSKKLVLSGIRATGRLHLGNYLGAVKGMLELQNGNHYKTLYMVADAHTVTTPYKIEELQKNRREVIIDYLSAGLDPEKSIIFQQAEVNEHFELAFYFSSVMSIARMQHLPTFKEKIKQHPQGSTMALLNYPVLMAADILVYKASLVPVGIDQEPHLEVAREIARKMNQLYGTDFPEPVRFATKGEYIPSLKGEGKMSKSVEGSYINLTDSKNIIQKKIRSIPTASIVGGEFTPGLKVLFKLVELYLPEKLENYKERFKKGSLMFSQMKDELAQTIYEDLKPFQEERARLEANPEYVDKVIREGAQKAKTIAQKTVKEVKEKMGLS